MHFCEGAFPRIVLSPLLETGGCCCVSALRGCCHCLLAHHATMWLPSFIHTSASSTFCNVHPCLLPALSPSCVEHGTTSARRHSASCPQDALLAGESTRDCVGGSPSGKAGRRRFATCAVADAFAQTGAELVLIGCPLGLHDRGPSHEVETGRRRATRDREVEPSRHATFAAIDVAADLAPPVFDLMASA
jgi:hypothetical protein